MNHHDRPKVSIGCPVYNGEKYIAQALDAILGQTFHDYELIICDNASTDQTESICLAYSQNDRRIKYHRNKKNLGPSANFNRVFALSSGQYFKWIAHDDLHEPSFLVKCVNILDQDPTVVLAFTRAITIDHDGHCIRKAWGAKPDLNSYDAPTRFRGSLSPPTEPIPLPIFGVIRADILAETRLFESYPECDRALLAELSLYGRLYEVPEALFVQRDHPSRVGPRLSKDPHGAGSIWKAGSGKKPMLLPHWKLFLRHMRAVWMSALRRREKVECCFVLSEWFKRQRKLLAKDVMRGAERIPLFGGMITSAYKKHVGQAWTRRVASAARQIDSITPRQATLILVDEAAFGIKSIDGRPVFPFIEKGGSYWGAPSNDLEAIHEVERLRSKGADFIIFGWPAFWWFDYYEEFIEFLHDSFTCIARNSNIVIYDLRSDPRHDNE